MTVFDRLEAQLLDAHPHRARRPRPAPRRIVAFAAAAAAVVAIGVAALSAGSSSSSAPAAQPGGAVPAVVRSQTTVSVLNATRKPYAGRAAKELAGHGWKIGKVTNAPGQPGKSSCVDFTPGHSQAATMVAKDLGIPNVVPPNPDYVRAAGPGADVIVVVGADRAR